MRLQVGRPIAARDTEGLPRSAVLPAVSAFGRLPSSSCWNPPATTWPPLRWSRQAETTYSNRDATFDLLPAATWDDPRDDERNISLTRETWQALAPFAKKAVRRRRDP